MSNLSSSKPLDSGITLSDLSRTEFSNEPWDCGDYRTVYRLLDFPDVVIKRIHGHNRPEYDATDDQAKYLEYWSDAEKSHQLEELSTWARLVEDGFGDLVPYHDVLITDEDEVVIIVEHIDFTQTPLSKADLAKAAPHLEPFFLGNYVEDLRPGTNFGLTSDNRYILRDAGA